MAGALIGTFTVSPLFMFWRVYIWILVWNWLYTNRAGWTYFLVSVLRFRTWGTEIWWTSFPQGALHTVQLRFRRLITLFGQGFVCPSQSTAPPSWLTCGWGIGIQHIMRVMNSFLAFVWPISRGFGIAFQLKPQTWKCDQNLVEILFKIVEMGQNTPLGLHCWLKFSWWRPPTPPMRASFQGFCHTPYLPSQKVWRPRTAKNNPGSPCKPLFWPSCLRRVSHIYFESSIRASWSTREVEIGTWQQNQESMEQQDCLPI